MRILISNDDGVYAPGIKALAARLAEDPQHEIFVVAPDRERSATGHALTLHKPLRVEEVELPGKMRRCWSTTGTPSDCVKLAISVLLEDQPPDLVISGINNGANLGADVLYSGTVAAAMEGAFLSVPSIAVSMAWRDEGKHFEVAADFMSTFVGFYKKAHLGPKSLLNVNIPSLPADRIKGVRVTELGIRAYDDRFEKRHDPRGRDYYWLTGHAIEEGEAETSDAFAVAHDIISITPIAFNMTDRAVMPKLESLPGLSDLAKFREKTVEK